MTNQKAVSGPELYALGNRHLLLAQLASEPKSVDYLERPQEYRMALEDYRSFVANAAAIAHAAFAGAQAAALGALAADEAESKELAQAWRDVIGDDPGPDVGDNPDSEAETNDGE